MRAIFFVHLFELISVLLVRTIRNGQVLWTSQLGVNMMSFFRISEWIHLLRRYQVICLMGLKKTINIRLKSVSQI